MTDKSTAGRDGEAGSTGFARVSLEAPRIDAATGLLSKEAFFDLVGKQIAEKVHNF